VADPTKSAEESEGESKRIEELATELAERLRDSPDRAELTDYAVNILRESAEEAAHQQQAEEMRQAAGKTGGRAAFNPIALAIPLFVIGAVLAATGILIGPGLGLIGLAVLTALYGVGAALFSGMRRAFRSKRSNPGRGAGKQ
jgi:hypothetical protein